MNIIDTAKSRYSTKVFDTTKPIDNKTLDQLEDLLQLSPSSTNLQQVRFIMVKSEKGKQILLDNLGKDHFNYDRVAKAPLIIVFTAQNNYDKKYNLLVADQEEKDGRFPEEKNKQEMIVAREQFATFHQDTEKDYHLWAAKQAYLNIGHFVLGAKALGVDTLIMEGFDQKKLDKQLELTSHGYHSVALVSCGYADKSDWNKTLPKSRLSKEVLIKNI